MWAKEKTELCKRLSMFKLKSINKSYLILLFFSVFLPSGYMFGVPVKHSIVILFLLSIFLYLSHNKISIRRTTLVNASLLFFSFAIFVAFYIFTGLMRQRAMPMDVIREAGLFVTTFAIVSVGWLLMELNILTPKNIIVAIFYSSFGYVLWKSTIVFGLYFGWFVFDDVDQFFLNQLNYDVVTSGISGGLTRFNLVICDIMIIFVMFGMLYYKNAYIDINPLARVLYFVFGSFAVFTAFSRYLFMIYPFVIFSWFVSIKGIKKYIAVIAVIVCFIFAFDWINNVYEERFGSEISYNSDESRKEQMYYLTEAWGEVPLIGGGFGYHSNQLIRSESIPYTYELQIVSFLMKFGILGMTYLCMFCALLIGMMVKYLPLKQGLLTIPMFVAFIVSGFTNQYLVSSASAVIYILFLAYTYYMRVNSGVRNA